MSRSDCSMSPTNMSRPNVQLFALGVSFKELTFGSHQLPEEFIGRRYGCKMHGVGLCDEWLAILLPYDWREGAFDYVLEPGMIMTWEVYVGAVGGREGVKLEDQVLITEDGLENVAGYGFDEQLLG
jgi:Xaa-Pro aminopeptidase